MSGLVPRPCYSFQHLQNCCHETKSRDWVGRRMHSVVCSKCEPASQREFLRSIYSFNRGAPHLHAANAYSKLPTGCFLQYLQSTRSKCQIWHCVGKECVMSMFANECFLQDLPALAAKLSKCGKFVSHKPACTRMQRTAGHIFPSSTCKNCCFANKRGCWVCTYIISAACSNCKAASQRKWLRSI